MIEEIKQAIREALDRAETLPDGDFKKGTIQALIEAYNIVSDKSK